MGFKVTIRLLPGEKDKVVRAIKTIEADEKKRRVYPSAVPISKIAREVHANVNRVRYIVDELVLEGRLKKIPIKDHGRYHTRYYYEVVE